MYYFISIFFLKDMQFSLQIYFHIRIIRYATQTVLLCFYFLKYKEDLLLYLFSYIYTYYIILNQKII